MELDYTAIGSRIKAIRKQRGITQQTLAEISDLNPSNISHIERGATKLSLPTIVKLANALGVTVDEFLCDSLQHSKGVFEDEISNLLTDCNIHEIKFLASALGSLKEGLRRFEES